MESQVSPANGAETKNGITRRNFFQICTKIGVEIAVGLAAFIPAASSIIKNASGQGPDYIVCSCVICQFVNNGSCIQARPWKCTDSRAPSHFCYCCGRDVTGCSGC